MRSRSEIVSVLGVALALTSIVACSKTPIACTDELRVEITPKSATLVVGERLFPSLRLYTCGGRTEVTDLITWLPEDASVVAVEGMSNKLIALKPGTTLVQVRGEKYGSVGSLPISVIASPGPSSS